MTDTRKTRAAKAAASEAIGKLVGDDAAVRKGRRDRATATDPSAADLSQKQE